MTAGTEQTILEELRSLRAEVCRLSLSLAQYQEDPRMKTYQVAAALNMDPREVRRKLVRTGLLNPIEGTTQFFHKEDVKRIKALIDRGSIRL